MEAIGIWRNKVTKTSLSASTKRIRVTSLIAEKQSREEFFPRIGKLIEKAHVELLHLKNSGCAFLFTPILEFAIEISKLTQNDTEFQMVNTNSPFSRLITSLKTEASLSCIAKKVVRWFDKGKEIQRLFLTDLQGKSRVDFCTNSCTLQK